MYVEYNGVILERAYAESWNEEVVYDSTGVNLIGNKITMTFQGNVYPAYYDNLNMQLVGGVAQGALTNDSDISTNAQLPNYADKVTGQAVSYEQFKTPASSTHVANNVYQSFNARLNVILRRLSMPRYDLFVYKWHRPFTGFDSYPTRIDDYPNLEGRDYLFKAFSQDEQVRNSTAGLSDADKRNSDVNNGPRPISVRIVQKTDLFAVISFTVEVTKIRCLAGETYDTDEKSVLGSDPTNENQCVVSHRCWTEESIDEHFYTTRVTHGRIQIMNPNTSIHWFRRKSTYYPALEDGFKRESVRFAESDDGLTLDYTVTDRQVQNAAPFPATSFSGSAAFSVINGAEMSMHMSITLDGRVDCQRQALLVRALQAVTAKLRNFSTASNGFIDKFTVTENLEDPPRITVNMSSKLFVLTKGTTEAPSELQMANIWFPLIGRIGRGVEFSSSFTTTGNIVVAYDRKKSPNPSPYGYNTYLVPQASEEGKIKWEELKRSDSAQFLHVVATAPCIVPSSSAQYVEGGGDEGAENNRLTTIVSKTDYGATEFITKSTNVTPQALTYPYTVYKSDISYGTDFKRVILPQQSEEKDPDEVRAKIAEKQQELLELIANKPQLIGGGEPPQDIIDQINESEWKIKKTRSEIEALEKLLNTTRVVELSRPVATARVVIEAERVGRMPEMPNPDEIVTTQASNPDDQISFTPVSVKTSHCDPIPTPMDDRLVYKTIGVYDYAMSRRMRKDDQLWLLTNPMYESGAFPTANDGRELPQWVLDMLSMGNVEFNQKIIEEYRKGTLKNAYAGKQLNHGAETFDTTATMEDMVGWNSIVKSNIGE